MLIFSVMCEDFWKEGFYGGKDIVIYLWLKKITDRMEFLGSKRPPSGSRSQTECSALTPSYEGNNSGDKNNPKQLEIPERTKEYTRGEFNRVTLLN